MNSYSQGEDDFIIYKFSNLPEGYSQGSYSKPRKSGGILGMKDGQKSASIEINRGKISKWAVVYQYKVIDLDSFPDCNSNDAYENPCQFLTSTERGLPVYKYNYLDKEGIHDLLTIKNNTGFLFLNWNPNSEAMFLEEELEDVYSMIDFLEPIT